MARLPCRSSPLHTGLVLAARLFRRVRLRRTGRLGAQAGTLARPVVGSDAPGVDRGTHPAPTGRRGLCVRGPRGKHSYAGGISQQVIARICAQESRRVARLSVKCCGRQDSAYVAIAMVEATRTPHLSPRAPSSGSVCVRVCYSKSEASFATAGSRLAQAASGQVPRVRHLVPALAARRLARAPAERAPRPRRRRETTPIPGLRAPAVPAAVRQPRGLGGPALGFRAGRAVVPWTSTAFFGAGGGALPKSVAMRL